MLCSLNVCKDKNYFRFFVVVSALRLVISAMDCFRWFCEFFFCFYDTGAFRFDSLHACCRLRPCWFVFVRFRALTFMIVVFCSFVLSLSCFVVNCCICAYVLQFVKNSYCRFAFNRQRVFGFIFDPSILQSDCVIRRNYLCVSVWFVACCFRLHLIFFRVCSFRWLCVSARFCWYSHFCVP